MGAQVQKARALESAALSRPAVAGEMAPMMKGTVMTKTALTAAIAESCEVKKGVIGKALSTLASIAAAETKKNGKFVVPGLVMIKTRKKLATKAGKREMFGKVVLVKAKPAKTVVKAFAAKALKGEFREEGQEGTWSSIGLIVPGSLRARACIPHLF